MSRRRALAALAGAATLTASGCAPERAHRRVEASLWFSYGGKNREVLLDLVRQFNESQPRWFVHATYQGDYFEALAKLRTAIAARAAPTVTHVVGEIVPYLAEAGVLEPLDALLGDVAADLVPELAQAKSWIDGDRRPLVALPFNRSTPIAYFSGSVLRDLGLAPPRTWDELSVFARAATSRSGERVERWGFCCPIDWWFWVALVGQAGGEVVAPDGRATLGGEAGVRALELWQTLVHRDRTMKPPPGRDYNAWQATNTDFLAGRAAMIWTSTAFVRYLEDNAKFDVIAAPLPRDVRAAVPTGGTHFVLPKGGAGPAREAGVAFLRFMAQPAQANAWATRTGYIPVSRAGISLLEREGFYTSHRNDRVALDQLADARPWPWATQLFRIQREAVQPRLEEAVLARRDARSLLTEARRAAEEP